MSCTTPLAIERLTAYRAGELAIAEVEQVEEHLFACDECGARAAWLEALAAGIGEATFAAQKPVVLTARLVDELRGAGVRMREYHAHSGQPHACAVSADDDLVVTHLHLAVAGIASADLIRLDASGKELFRLADVPVDTASGVLVYASGGALLRTLPSTRIHLRLEANGRVVGDYIYDHTGFKP